MPVLRNGQHRVQALYKLLDEQAKLSNQNAFDQNGRAIRAPRTEVC